MDVYDSHDLCVSPGNVEHALGEVDAVELPFSSGFINECEGGDTGAAGYVKGDRGLNQLQVSQEMPHEGFDTLPHGLVVSGCLGVVGVSHSGLVGLHPTQYAR